MSRSRQHQLEAAIDHASAPAVIDLDWLRHVCAQGPLPDFPPLLRQRIWRLLLGVLPPEKASWNVYAQANHRRYYAIARRLVEDLPTGPLESAKLGPKDHVLDSIAKDVARMQAFIAQLDPPTPRTPSISSEGRPGSSSSEDTSPPMASFQTMTDRLATIRRGPESLAPPPPPLPPQIMVVTIGEDGEESAAPSPPTSHDPLAPPLDLPNGGKPAFDIQASLIRILYFTANLHPDRLYNQAWPALLSPIYYVVASAGAESADPYQAEADAFWTFGELLADVDPVLGVIDRDGKEDRGVQGLLDKLSQRVRWADYELWDVLHRKSLDPALPYWSFRWISCMIVQTLPLHSTIYVWDLILAQPPSSSTSANPTADEIPRLAFLVDICASMLIRLKSLLTVAGNKQKGGLWGLEEEEEDRPLALVAASSNASSASADPSSSGTMGDGFVEGMKILQTYPIEAIGVPSIITGAWWLVNKEKEERAAAEALAKRAASANYAISRVTEGLGLKGFGWGGGGVGRPASASSPSSEGGPGRKSYEATEPTYSPTGSAATTPKPIMEGERERPASKSLRYGYFDVGDAAARLSKARSNLTATAIAWSSSTSTKPAPGSSTPHSRTASNDSNTDHPRSQSQSNGHSRMGSITSATGSLSKFDVRSWMSGTSMGMTRSSTASSTASDRDADSRRSSSSAQSGNGRKDDSWGTTSRHVRIESASSDVSLIAPSLVHDGDDGDDSQLATYRNRMPISTPMAIAMAMRERASLPPLPSPPSGTASDFQTSPALPPPPTTPNNPRTLPDFNGGTKVSPHARSPSLPYGTSLASPFLRARTPQPPPTTPLSQNQTLGMPESMPRSPLPSPTPSSSSIGSKSTPRGSGVRPLILSNRRVTRDSVSPGPAAGSLSRQSSLSSRASDAENAPSRIVPLNRRRRVVGTAHSASGSVVGSVSGSPIQSPSMSGRMLVSPTSEPRSSASAEEMMLAAADDFGVLVPVGKGPSSAPAAVAGAPQLSLPPSSSLHPPGVDDTELDIPDFDENNEGRDRRATIVPTRNSNGSAQSHSPSTTNPGPPTPTDSPEREGVAVWRESSASASSLSAAPISHVARRGATLPDAMSSKELVGMALEGTKGVQPKDDDRSFALRGSPSLQRQTRLRAKRSLKNVSPLDAIAPRSMTLPAASSHTNITAAPVVNGAGPSALAKHSLVPSPQYGDSDEDEGANGLGAVFGGDREKMMHSLSVPSNGTPGIGSSSLGSLVGSPITPRQTLYADDPSPRSHSRSPSPSPNAAIGGSLARRPSPKPRRTRKVSNRKDSKQQDASAVEEQDDGAGMSVPYMQSEEEGVKGDDEGDGDYEDLLSAYSTDADQA